LNIGKTLGTNYMMKTSTIPSSILKLNEVDFEKDLGIWTEPSLKFSLQCDKAAACATRMLKRTFEKISKDLLFFYTRHT